MSPEQVPTDDTVRKILEAIAADAEADVTRYEGAPFTGQTLAAYQGEQNAMIQALARGCLYLLARVGTVDRRLVEVERYVRSRR